MDIQFFGANCVAVTYKGSRVVVDDNLAELGAKGVLRSGDIALFTGSLPTGTPSELKLLVSQPGEYEVADISIVGIAAQSHMDEAGKETATMYKVTAGDMNLLFIGHIYPDMNDTQLEAIGPVDVMFVPVGGNGYTLDAVGALKLIKEFEPRLIIPTHFADKDLKYPVPQQELDNAIKELGMEPKEKVAKLKIKPADLADTGPLIVLEKP